jgi:hypothetical protein
MNLLLFIVSFVEVTIKKRTLMLFFSKCLFASVVCTIYRVDDEETSTSETQTFSEIFLVSLKNDVM